MESNAITEKFQKLTQREHVLHRPDTYCGSVAVTSGTKWLLKELDAKGVPVLEEKNVQYVPALCSLIDELLVNAADRVQVDPECDTIKVEFNRKEGFVSVWNNGKAVPVQKHPKYGVLVPELLFGSMLTSSNYDDKKERVVGGRNGLGEPHVVLIVHAHC
jgi:DNA topoisomerase-2